MQRTFATAVSTVAFSLAALSMVACGGPSLAGDWTVAGDKMPPGSTGTINFTGSTSKMVVTAGQGGMNIKITMDGTYTLKGEELTMTTTAVNIDDSQIPAQYKPMIEPAKQELNKSVGKPQTGTMKLEGDVATFTGKDADGKAISMTFTRVKK